MRQGGLRDEDGRFPPDRQAEIVALAARLQAADAERASAPDLERAAAEAGIEPRFVREAMARLGQPTETIVRPQEENDSVLTPLGLAATVPYFLFSFLLALGGNSNLTNRHRVAFLAIGVGLAALGGAMTRAKWFALFAAVSCGALFRVEPTFAVLAAGVGGAAAWFTAEGVRGRTLPRPFSEGWSGGMRAGFLAAVFAAQMVIGSVLSREFRSTSWPWWQVAMLAYVFAVGPLIALGAGAVARRRGLAEFAGFISGALLVGGFPGSGAEPTFLVGIVGAVLGGIGGWWARRGDDPPAPAPRTGDDRLDRLERLAALRTELESERPDAAFLSVDVVGSRDLRARLGELDAERVMRRYHLWIEAAARAEGGEVAATAGDGAMVRLPDGVAAVGVAKRLLAGRAAFAAEIGCDLHVRLGIAVGPAPAGPVGAAHSAAADRAATRQRAARTDSVVAGPESAAALAVAFGGIESVADGFLAG